MMTSFNIDISVKAAGNRSPERKPGAFQKHFTKSKRIQPIQSMISDNQTRLEITKGSQAIHKHLDIKKHASTNTELKKEVSKGNYGNQ